MSVIKMKASDGEASPLSGGGMDRVVEKKGLSKRVKLGIGGALLLVAATSFYTMAPDASSQTVAADRVTVSTVERGTFDDFLPFRARLVALGVDLAEPFALVHRLTDLDRECGELT